MCDLGDSVNAKDPILIIINIMIHNYGLRYTGSQWATKYIQAHLANVVDELRNEKRVAIGAEVITINDYLDKFI